jgi:hypothetical protein
VRLSCDDQGAFSDRIRTPSANVKATEHAKREGPLVMNARARRDDMIWKIPFRLRALDGRRVQRHKGPCTT